MTRINWKALYEGSQETIDTLRLELVDAEMREDENSSLRLTIEGLRKSLDEAQIQLESKAARIRRDAESIDSLEARIQTWRSAFECLARVSVSHA